jgi:hypothetical protein
MCRIPKDIPPKNNIYENCPGRSIAKSFVKIK